jgi:hypothetical protein
MRKIFFAVFLLSSFSLFGQYTSACIYMFAPANGLRVRDNPSLNGRIITTLPYGEKLDLNKRTVEKDTIDGISDYWYSCRISINNESVEGWVFGGYLIDRLESETIVGFWRMENNRQYIWYFYPNRRFLVGMAETSNSEVGSYELRGNTLILIYDASYDRRTGELGSPSRKEARVQIINGNRIIIVNDDDSPYYNRPYIRDNQWY